MTLSATDDLPDHYPLANASWEEKLSWLAAEKPPFDRMREAIPWLKTDEQLGWYLDGLREAMAKAEHGDTFLRASKPEPASGTLGPLNHVGIATPSIEKSVAMYRDLLGATAVREAFDLPAQGVRVCFIDTPNAQIELIEPLGEGSPIHGFLARNPAGGQHHVCFEVPDIRAAKAELEAKGAKVLGEPRIGAHGTLVIFVHPKDMGGVLVELMETPERRHRATGEAGGTGVN